MRYRSLITLILVSGLVVSSSVPFMACGKEKTTRHSFTITGDITGMPQLTVVLELLRANDSLKVVDSQRSDAAGHFAFKDTTTDPGLYRLHFTQDKFILLAIDKGDIKLHAAWPITSFVVDGSPASAQLQLFVDTVIGYMTLMNQSKSRVDSFRMTGQADKAGDEEKMRQAITVQFRNMVKRYCSATEYEPNAIIAARVLNPQEDIAFYQTFSAGLDTRFPGTTMTREFHDFMKRMMASMPEPNDIGNKAPELILNDTAGKEVTLSSYRGKYVLVDFWASWCGPCRAENPNVLAAYKKYKDKNFTIMAVSLDNNKVKWLEAVHHDALMWRQVSDLKGWQSPAAAKYGVQAIPTNFLVDPNGVIIAKNLRGPALEEKLKEVLK